MKKILEKFNTTEELADAYRALESAFTKKCQELARLRDRGSDGEETAETDAQADSDAAAEAEAMRPRSNADPSRERSRSMRMR